MITGQIFDGQSSKKVSVQVDLSDDKIISIHAPETILKYERSQVEISGAVGSVRTLLYLPDGAVCELDQVMPEDRHRHSFIHFLENHLIAILAVLAFALMLFWLIVEFGVPYAAKKAAMKIPVAFEQKLGEETLGFLDKALFKPSQLSSERQQFYLDQFYEYAGVTAETFEYKILFRASEKIGANALALPAGSIVLTDELVNLLQDADLITAVLAHEIGHVVQRHTLRQILQNSMTGLLIVLVTGDMGSAESIAAALPTLLVQMKFSRLFEMEADDYAANWLEERDLSPQLLAEALTRLTAYYGIEARENNGFFSTHPAPEERILRLP